MRAVGACLRLTRGYHAHGSLSENFVGGRHFLSHVLQASLWHSARSLSCWNYNGLPQPLQKGRCVFCQHSIFLCLYCT